MNQKGVGVILIVILVTAAALLGGYFIYQKQPKPTPSPQPSPLSTEAPAKVEDPTANWKTYTHPLKFFSFKVPSDWILDYKSDPEIQLSNTNLVNPIPSYKGRTLAITIYIDNNSAATLQSYVTGNKNKSIELHGTEAIKPWKESPFILDDQPAIRVERGGLFSGTDIYVQDPSETVVLSFSFIGDYDNFPGLIDQILSTFKFTQ